MPLAGPPDPSIATLRSLFGTCRSLSLIYLGLALVLDIPALISEPAKLGSGREWLGFLCISLGFVATWAAGSGASVRRRRLGMIVTASSYAVLAVIETSRGATAVEAAMMALTLLAALVPSTSAAWRVQRSEETATDVGTRDASSEVPSGDSQPR